MSWTCSQCGAAVDGSADRCWSCKGPRPEPQAGSGTVSTEVLESEQPIAPADLLTQSAPASPSVAPLSPPAELAATRPWTCSRCGETVDAGFLVCWSCGTSIEGVEDPSFVGADEPAAVDDEPAAVDDESAVPTLFDAELDEPAPGPASRPCSHCRGPLEPGFIADFQQGQNVMRPSEWVAGIPQSSFWTGTWTGDRRYPIRAFRCTDCGHLEFWAGEPADDA